MIETQTISPPIFKELANLKVLLAEDNEVNQLLAKNILQHWGVQSKTATTGNQVLDLMNQEDFDIVLMDIQMPEKSGIEAAFEIRHLADPRKKNIPIIALTANALKGEEKKYIAVGIDDFLTKPFKQEDLYEVIINVMNSRKEYCSNTMENFELHQKGIALMEKLYDLSYIKDLAGNNPAFIESLIKIFIETTPGDSTEMVKLCNEKKWEDVSKMAHKLKSTIDSLRLDAIKDDIRTIEADAKSKVNLDQVIKLVAKVDRIIADTTLQLKQDFNL